MKHYLTLEENNISLNVINATIKANKNQKLKIFDKINALSNKNLKKNNKYFSLSFKPKLMM